MHWTLHINVTDNNNFVLRTVYGTDLVIYVAQKYSPCKENIFVENSWQWLSNKELQVLTLSSQYKSKKGLSEKTRHNRFRNNYLYKTEWMLLTLDHLSCKLYKNWLLVLDTFVWDVLIYDDRTVETYSTQFLYICHWLAAGQRLSWNFATYIFI